jgi:hypothetical protein
MLYVLRTTERLEKTYDLLDRAVEILANICPTTMECFVILANDVRMKDNKKVRGRYLLLDTWFPCAPDNKSRGAIFIDEDEGFVSMCTVLVHEYAHHLSQQGHGGMLFELFKNWLRTEFVKRWNGGDM